MKDLLAWNFMWVMLPTALAGVMHMAAVRYRVASWLAIPLWPRGFGPNKTWRGIIFMVGLTSGTTALVASMVPAPLPVPAAIWGGGLGLVYVLAELPNSWIKRRMGISAGAQSRRYPYLSALADKLDSALLGAAILGWWIPNSPSSFVLHSGIGFGEVFAVSLLFNSGIHALLSWILVAVGLKHQF